MPFTDAGAWELIANLMEMEVEISEVTLRQPEGEKAYEVKIRLGVAEPLLYIKVQVKGETVFGRSFHYDYKVN
jgi:hypothetical protein